MFALLEEEKGAGGALGARLGCQLPFPGRINSHLLCLPPLQSGSSPAHLPGFTQEPCRGRAGEPALGRNGTGVPWGSLSKPSLPQGAVQEGLDWFLSWS